MPIFVEADLPGRPGAFRGELPQGLSPSEFLRNHGYAPCGHWSTSGVGGDITLRTDAHPATPTKVALDEAGSRASEFVADVSRQRLAAYGVVTSSRGVLLTQLSARTGRPGMWILPGGGVDDRESPSAALVREIWEEAGQEAITDRFVDVFSSHYQGTGREGLNEDFHAVRLIYTAHCDEPTTPVVHDVGGSTSEADWFSFDQALAMGDQLAIWAHHALVSHLTARS